MGGIEGGKDWTFGRGVAGCRLIRGSGRKYCSFRVRFFRAWFVRMRRGSVRVFEVKILDGGVMVCEGEDRH